MAEINISDLPVLLDGVKINTKLLLNNIYLLFIDILLLIYGNNEYKVTEVVTDLFLDYKNE